MADKRKLTRRDLFKLGAGASAIAATGGLLQGVARGDETGQKIESLPQVPEGTQVALVRRMILIDSNGQPRISPLIERVQIRAFYKAKTDLDSQALFEFNLDRGQLFAGRTGGF